MLHDMGIKSKLTKILSLKPATVPSFKSACNYHASTQNTIPVTEGRKSTKGGTEPPHPYAPIKLFPGCVNP